MQGFDMRIDENGNAQGNYTLLSLQNVIPIKNKSDPNYYPLNSALTITADFINTNSNSENVLRFLRQIKWLNDEPPLDEPKCGFLNDKCKDYCRFFLLYNFLKFSFETGIFSFTFGIFSLRNFNYNFCEIQVNFLKKYFYITIRNKKFEKELSMVWKIDPNELSQIVIYRSNSTHVYVNVII